MNPKILIAATSRWFPSVRLAIALANAGCAVEAVCPSGHPLEKASAVRQTYTYRGLMPVMSFAEAITQSNPDLIIPGDDLATWHLHLLYGRELSKGKKAELCQLIERSLGAPESFPVIYSRSDFMEVARATGVRAPKTRVIQNAEDLSQWVKVAGFPTVLKANGTSGGGGVRVVHTFEEAERAFRTLQAPPLLARAAKRALADRDRTLVWPALLRQRKVVNAQAFITGHEATSTIACWKGKTLAGLHFEVVNKATSFGHATVVRLIENPEMSSAVERIVQRLDLSGMYGFDFMIEAATGNAQLLEINPRATQVGHLTLGAGRDLPGALCSAITGTAVREAPTLTDNKTIALFPQEWVRDPASSYLQSAYHDVPWQEPELVQTCIQDRSRQSSWYPPPKEPIRSLSAVRLTAAKNL